MRIFRNPYIYVTCRCRNVHISRLYIRNFQCDSYLNFPHYSNLNKYKQNIFLEFLFGRKSVKFMYVLLNTRKLGITYFIFYFKLLKFWKFRFLFFYSFRYCCMLTRLENLLLLLLYVISTI